MQKALKIIHLENKEEDAALVRQNLEQAGVECDIQRVENETDFVSALNHGPVDFILADRLTPTFDGFSAMKTAKKICPETPFIFVSDSLDEDLAIETLKSGATDYVLKHRLARLMPAVNRALDEAKSKKENRVHQEHMFRAQKIESLGTLVSGIAHDFNNILGIIQGYNSLLEDAGMEQSARSETVSTVKQATERGAALVRQLLTFARKTEVSSKEVNVNESIEELLKMLEHTIPRTIAMETHLDAKLPTIIADSNQIYQAMLNLCINARDAMPKGGKLVITTEVVAGLDVRCRCPEAKDVPYIDIQVTDTGCGMSEETKDRIFDPFFTTKEKDKGTGLGLAVVYGVMQSHHGFVEVETKPDAGTTFHLVFPVSHQESDIAPGSVETQEEVFDSNETILLVEDEEILRTLAKNFLEAKGYRVLIAKDGYEAINVYSEHSDEIDLVLADLGLPKIGGQEMFLQMRKINPEVLVILCSGFLQAHFISKMLIAGVKDFILKPYTAGDVLHKIRGTLEAARKFHADGVLAGTIAQ